VTHVPLPDNNPLIAADCVPSVDVCAAADDTRDSLGEVRAGYVAWKNWQSEKFGSYTRFEAASFTAELVGLLPVGRRARVLELGFGNGQFLGWCGAQGIDCCGVEIDAEMRRRAREFGVAVFASTFDRSLETHEQTFDVVAAFDVLEHIELHELVRTLRQVARLLRPGGHLLARFPNGDSPFGRVNQHGDLTHVTTLGRSKLQQLAELSGMQLISFADPRRPWRSVGFRGAIRRLAGSAVKKVLETTIRTLYFGGEKVCFDRNAVAILRRLRDTTS